MELEITQNDYSKKISKNQEKFCAEKISSLFEDLEKDRSEQLCDLEMIKNEIYCKNKPATNSWNAHVNIPDIYEIAQTLKSHLIENLYSHPEAMFDVSGTTPQSQSYANLQKAMLVDTFEKMNFELELEKLVDSIIEAGESTMFVGWNTRIKQVRRRRLPSEIVENESPYCVDTKVVYDGAVVKHIPCEDFVYDVDMKVNWDKCPKIYRTYKDFEDITCNESNNLLTKEKKALLRLMLDSKSKKKDVKAVKNNRIEILEYWGDFELDDKTILKNWLIVIAGRSQVIRFEPNPFVINPFVHGNIIEDPQTGRGISPLKIAVGLNRLSSTILNKQLDALSLMINPPYLAPKGCFRGEQVVEPGKIIEYDAALMPNQPVALKFDSALRGWDFIQNFKSTIESATGVFKNMSGNLASDQRTATELTYSLNGQAVRLSMIIDSINRKLIIPMVEKTADIIANFKYGPETVAAKTHSGISFLEVNDEVRCADYVYRYGDRKATLERKYRFKEMLETMSGFAKIQEVHNKIDWLECFKFALEQYGIENSDNFIKSEEDSAKNINSPAAPQNPQIPAGSASPQHTGAMPQTAAPAMNNAILQMMQGLPVNQQNMNQF